MIKNINISEIYKTSIIAVDAYDEVRFCAKLYNPFYKECIQINSFQQLIKELDALMNEIGCPMSGMEKRSFVKSSRENERAMFIPNKTQAPSGKVATFAMKIQYRNNASWQGIVKWLEGEAEEYFRSVLEFFWLLDSAMTAQEASKEENVGISEENLEASCN